MSLVNYSSSSESEAAAPASPSHENIKKRKRANSSTSAHTQPTLPPLPSTFHDLYASAARVSTTDDPSLHDGRKRTVPHIEGHWPTHVYLDWRPNASEGTTLSELVETLQSATLLTTNSGKNGTIHSLLQTPLGTPAPLHVSLSRALSIPTDSREAFEDMLRTGIARAKAKPFILKPSGSARWFGNEEGERWFFVIGVEECEDTMDAENRASVKGEAREQTALSQLLFASNTAARTLDLPELYAGFSSSQKQSQHLAKRRRSSIPTACAGGDIVPLSPASNSQTSPSHSPFHISLAWTLERPSTTQELQSQLSIYKLQDMRIQVDAVKLKSGNEISTIWLDAPQRRGQRGPRGEAGNWKVKQRHESLIERKS